jgi:predicted dehydrogenase
VPRFDAHIEVYSPSRIVRVDYDTPYVRNLPGRLTVLEPGPDGMAQRQVRSTWRDAFEIEWLAFHENVTGGRQPKTSLTDAREDLVLFREMMSIMQDSASAPDAHERTVASG